MEEQDSFDYNFLGKCQHLVPGSCLMGPEPETDCGAPAIARGWWVDGEADSILLCAYHLAFAQEQKRIRK